MVEFRPLESKDILEWNKECYGNDVGVLGAAVLFLFGFAGISCLIQIQAPDSQLQPSSISSSTGEFISCFHSCAADKLDLVSMYVCLSSLLSALLICTTRELVTEKSLSLW